LSLRRRVFCYYDLNASALLIGSSLDKQQDKHLSQCLAG
jgi:hypothetical protein